MPPSDLDTVAARCRVRRAALVWISRGRLAFQAVGRNLVIAHPTLQLFVA